MVTVVKVLEWLGLLTDASMLKDGTGTGSVSPTEIRLKIRTDFVNVE